MISADAITSRTFTTVRFKEGYSAREVDDFFDEIVDRMTTGDHSLARRIKEKTFSNVRFREGYDIDEVDDFLDEVARGLEGDAGASTGAAPGFQLIGQRRGPGRAPCGGRDRRCVRCHRGHRVPLSSAQKQGGARHRRAGFVRVGASRQRERDPVGRLCPRAGRRRRDGGRWVECGGRLSNFRRGRVMGLRGRRRRSR